MRMKQDAIRQALIDGTIHVIACDGLYGATTKRIGNTTGINEAYIYRNFKDKDDMFVQTFSQLDHELVAKVLEVLPIMSMTNIKVQDRCFMLFSSVWKFFLQNREKCKCYISYYYSPFFKMYSYDEHKENFVDVVEQFTPAFKKGVDVWILLNHILDVLLASAIKVYNDDLPDDDKTAVHVFNLLYSSVESMLAWSERKVMIPGA